MPNLDSLQFNKCKLIWTFLMMFQNVISAASHRNRLVPGFRSRGAHRRGSTGGRLERRLCPHVNCTAQTEMGTRTRFWTAQQRKPNMDRKKLKRRTGTVKTQRMKYLRVTKAGGEIQRGSRKQNNPAVQRLWRRNSSLQSHALPSRQGVMLRQKTGRRRWVSRNTKEEMSCECLCEKKNIHTDKLFYAFVQRTLWKLLLSHMSRLLF